MAIDKDSNSFKEFQGEMKQKLNTRLYDKIMDAKKDVAGQMSNFEVVPETPPHTPAPPEE